ncbi:MAG: CoA transferase [Acidimicrobiia bacterium]|nr:CoA transferase [Acidimicrobiia bacterium]
MAGAKPLDGVRVANLGWVWAGPIVGQTLAFLGAEVYKIESRARLDTTRLLPPYAEGEPGPDRSLSNHAGWAGNGSVTINLKEPEGVELALDVIRHCDVVVENFAPGAMERMGLGYEKLRAVRPDVILFSMPAAGLSGPLRDIRAYGLSLASITGLDSLTGYEGGPPLAMENAFTDPYNGIMGAFSILVALNHRRRTGRGQHIDYSQQEAVMQMVGPAFMDYVLNDRVSGPKGNKHPLGMGAPHGVFPCAGDDRWIAIAVTGDDEWRGLAEAAAADGAAFGTSGDYGDHESRLRNIDALHGEIAAWTAGFDDRELARRLQAVAVPATPVLHIGDLLDDPHYRARGTWVEVTHPLGFTETQYGAYVKTSRSDLGVGHGPMIGQDNEHVLCDIVGLDRDRYDRLVEEKVIY